MGGDCQTRTEQGEREGRECEGDRRREPVGEQRRGSGSKEWDVGRGEEGYGTLSIPLFPSALSSSTCPSSLSPSLSSFPSLSPFLLHLSLSILISFSFFSPLLSRPVSVHRILSTVMSSFFWLKSFLLLFLRLPSSLHLPPTWST